MEQHAELQALASRGGDLERLKALALADRRSGALTEQLTALGYTKLGARQRVTAALISAAADVPPSAQQPAGPSTSASSTVQSMVVTCARRTEPVPFMGVHMPSDPDPNGVSLPLAPDFPGLHLVRDQPRIYVVEGFATAEECDSIMKQADPLLMRSRTDGGVSETRTSQSCHLLKSAGACPALLRRVHALTGKPASHMEDPQVARYEEGQFYGDHYDSVPKEAARAFADEGGNRLCTVLLYLNDVERGGETRFSFLGLQVSPRKGCALVFFPCFLGGSVDPRTLHQAVPAVKRKYVCQVWVRESAVPLESGAAASRIGHRLLEALHERK